MPLSDAHGWLVYSRDESLVARQLDLRSARFAGKERLLLERVGYTVTGTAAAFRISLNGRVLLYRESAAVPSGFLWFERNRPFTGGTPLPDGYTGPVVSPACPRMVASCSSARREDGQPGYLDSGCAEDVCNAPDDQPGQ